MTSSTGSSTQTPLHPLLYLALLLPLAYILRKPLLRLVTPRGIPDVPAFPNPSPLLGDLPMITKVIKETGSFSAFFDKAARELGPIAQVRMSYLMTLVILSDIQETEAVFNSKPSTWDRSRDTISMFRTVIPRGQLSLRTDSTFKHHRRIMGPAMTSKYLSSTTPKAAQAASELVELFMAKAKIAGDRGFQAEDDLNNATLDAICGMAFGTNWGLLKARQEQIRRMTSVPTGSLGEADFKLHKVPLAESLDYLFESIPIQSPVPTVSHFITRLNPAYHKHHRRLHTFLGKAISQARAKAQQMGADAAVELADNTLDMMVARELRGDDFMPDRDMRDELVVYLLAGTETSATTLAWWVKYMTNHPEIQRKLRAHLLDRLPQLLDRAPTFDDLTTGNVPYLDAVIHETLPMEDTMVLGRRIPKGTVLLGITATGWEDSSTPVYAGDSADDEDAVARSQRLQGVRTDKTARKYGFWQAGTGKRFMPERWLDEAGQFDSNAGPSLPFSTGQRACFGKNLAMLELRVFVTQLNLAIFFAPVTEDQNSFVNYETVTNHPRQSIIRPVSWDSSIASAASASPSA